MVLNRIISTVGCLGWGGGWGSLFRVGFLNPLLSPTTTQKINEANSQLELI